MTNREWLNSLSDEELSEFILARMCGVCDYNSNECEAECKKELKEWLKQEHKKSIKLSDAERVILENIDKKYKWIVRDKFKDRICIYKEKPMIDGDVWDDVNQEWTFLDCYNHLFEFIQWEDEEPYSIEELLKKGK